MTIGTGPSGLERAPQLTGRVLAIAMVELSQQLVPSLDPDMAFTVEEALTCHGVEVRPGATAS